MSIRLYFMIQFDIFIKQPRSGFNLMKNKSKNLQKVVDKCLAICYIKKRCFKEEQKRLKKYLKKKVKKI